jgi:hypothetical protein
MIDLFSVIFFITMDLFLIIYISECFILDETVLMIFSYQIFQEGYWR